MAKVSKYLFRYFLNKRHLSKNLPFMKMILLGYVFLFLTVFLPFRKADDALDSEFEKMRRTFLVKMVKGLDQAYDESTPAEKRELVDFMKTLIKDDYKLLNWPRNTSRKQGFLFPSDPLILG